MLRVIDEIRPTWVVGENVAGITTMVEAGILTPMGWEGTLFGAVDRVHRYGYRGTFTIERICRDLEGLGYSVQPMLIPAAAVGAPHRRDRIFILAYNDADPENLLRDWSIAEHEGKSARKSESELGDCGRTDASSDTLRIRRREVHEHIQPRFTDGSEPFGDGGKQTSPYAADIGLSRAAVARAEGEICGEMEGQGYKAECCLPASPAGRRGSASHADSRRLEGSSERRGKGAGDDALRRGGICCEETASNSDCQRRQEPQQPGRGTDSPEAEAGLDNRAFGPCGYEGFTDTYYARLSAARESGVYDPKERDDERRSAGMYSDDAWLEGTWWDNFPTVSPVHAGNDGIPIRMDGVTLPASMQPKNYRNSDRQRFNFGRWRTESLKAYGNAIVPQVMYRIFQAIKEVEMAINPKKGLK